LLLKSLPKLKTLANLANAYKNKKTRFDKHNGFLFKKILKLFF